MPQPKPPIPAPPMLEYGQHSRLGWIGRHRKKLILLAICIAIAIPIYRYREPLKHRVLWLHWSHRAAAFKMPQIDPNAPVLFEPAEFTELEELDARVGSANLQPPMLFMGSLRRPDGIRRLVIVTGTSSDRDRLADGVKALVLPIPGVFDSSPPRPIPWPVMPWGVPFRTGSPPTPVTHRSGRIDTSDLSHLILPYSLGQAWGFGRKESTAVIIGQGEIDLMLQNDDSLKLRLRGPGQLAVASLPGSLAAIIAEQQSHWTTSPTPSSSGFYRGPATGPAPKQSR